MKKLYFFALGIFFIAACKQKPVDDTVVDYAIGETLAKVKYKAGEIMTAVEQSGYHERDLELLHNVKRVTSFKKQFIATNAIPDLLLYADSVNWAVRALTIIRNSEQTEQMQKNKDLVVQNPDSIDIKRLFFWSLKAEEMVLDVLAQQLGSECYIGAGPVSGYLSKEDISTGDTVYITFGLEIPKERV
ncbi:MAG: hypothetical protein LPK19_14475, partial [Hymenobacteraceae bacterium]|nr:hypothetical protein [Hymenobacteraceae bacterium]MDX5397436.1 hypothetical protein [Hymenobacteraceae bacterium]MDX5513514.1 hypothetical protein [Hymenobacteraceae bacterium]